MKGRRELKKVAAAVEKVTREADDKMHFPSAGVFSPDAGLSPHCPWEDQVDQCLQPRFCTSLPHQNSSGYGPNLLLMGAVQPDSGNLFRPYVPINSTCLLCHTALCSANTPCSLRTAWLCIVLPFPITSFHTLFW